MYIFKRIIRIFSYVVILLGLGALTLCAFSSDKLEITNYSYSNSKVSSTFKAAVISDYHHRELQFSNTNLIDEINKLDEDIEAIFYTGDLIDAHVNNLDNISKIFEASKKKTNNLYFVTGNHEEYAPLYSNLKDLFVKYNINFLDNKVDVTTFASKNVYLYGLQDPRFDTHNLKRMDYGKSKEYLDKFKPQLEDTSKIHILLAHRPEFAKLYSEYNFDYVLSGHSHGGQFRIGNFTPWKLLYGEENYVRGQYKINNTNLIVSAGLGYSAMFPLRINCNPEIVTLTISK